MGQTYCEFRAALMIRNNEGLTKTYNRFYHPDERSAVILRFRALHDAMDRAVFAAYGPPLADLTVPPCDFLPYYEDEEQEETDKRQNKKPWRYRWPDEFRDQVLALLLELNKQRAEQEQKATASKPKAKPSPRRTNKDSSNISQGISFNFAVTDIALGDFA